jgi:adenosylmethionine-8-amino-7-oxononanoate aminotransferase
MVAGKRAYALFLEEAVVTPNHAARLAEIDRAHLLHPIVEFRAHEKDGPFLILASGEGVHLETADGRRLIDAMSGLAHIAVGHGRTEIAEAAAAQMRKLASYHSFYGFSAEPPILLAERLAGLLPDDREIDHFIFTNGGSDANETAFRLARLYHALRGEPGRRKILSRTWGYHGITRAAGSATRIPAYHLFDEPDPLHVQTVAPYCLRCELGKTYPTCGLACADDVEATIRREGPETVAAIIVEPVIGTGGMIVPPPDYFARLQEICRAHDVLLILDEVITGFGRTGKWFALEHWDVHPDLLTLAKGITSGYVPLGAVGVKRRVYETVRDASPEGAPFMMGITSNNHPTACAAALANLDIIENEGLVENAAKIGPHLFGALKQALAGHPYVREIRHIGLAGAIEFGEEGTLAPVGGVPEAFSHAVADEAFERGMIARAIWENVGCAPPLCVTASEADEIVRILVESVEAATRALS